MDEKKPKKNFSHIDEDGEIRMVNVGHKIDTKRVAKAHSSVRMNPETLRSILEGESPKGNIFTTAKIAGIMAAKKTYELIPLCHNITVTKVDINFKVRVEDGRVEIFSEVESVGKTGVEMEALTAVSVAALTVYDMCKAVDKGIEITEIYLLEKKGGKSGHWLRNQRSDV